MSFRCLFIIHNAIENDFQPFCYKYFDNLKVKNRQKSNLPNFNEWYLDILSTLKDSNYTSFNEDNIQEYLPNPVFRVETRFGPMQPSLLIAKNKIVFGGLLIDSGDEKQITNYGTCVDFVINMSQYFVGMLKRNPRMKMQDLMLEFYSFVKVMCPYGTPLTASTNILDFFKYPEAALRSLHPSYEKRPLPIDQLPPLLASKNKEVRICIQEVVTGVQHEDRNGQLRSDIDITGEVLVSCSGLGVHEEISMVLQPRSLSRFMSRVAVTDVLVHPCCISGPSYKSPRAIAIQQRNQATSIERGPSDSQQAAIESSLLLQSLTASMTTGSSLSRPSSHLSSPSLSLSRSRLSSITELSANPTPQALPLDLQFKVRPTEVLPLLSYRLLQPFNTETGGPLEPPLLCVYQLEDSSSTAEASANIVLRLRLHEDLLLPAAGSPTSKKEPTLEMQRLEVILPFPNRPSLQDVAKCTVSHGRLSILEQNRHVLVWSIGSNFKGKTEASLMGTIKFSVDESDSTYTDPLCVVPNAYAQINFSFKSSNISGLFVDPKSFQVASNAGVKMTQRQECVSHNFMVWNSLGDCPMELS